MSADAQDPASAPAPGRDPGCDLVFHNVLEGGPWEAPHLERLPGMGPIEAADWLVVDESYADQMALRTRLIERVRDRVIGQGPEASPAVRELLATVLSVLSERSDFDVTAERVTRPDGEKVPLNDDDALGTLGRLVAEDLCILERPGGASEHVLTAAVLCFPSEWTLAEKLGRPMMRIHAPVTRYTSDVGRRVQRLMDVLRPGQYLMRRNAIPTEEPWLFTPKSESDGAYTTQREPEYLRSERQVFAKLPQTGAVVFSIQTRLLPFSDLPPEQAAAARKHLADRHTY